MEKLHTDLYYDIFRDIYTQDEVHEFISKIDSLLFKIYQQKGNVHQHISAIFSPEMTVRLLDVAVKHNIDVNNHIFFQQFLLDIKHKVSSLSTITLFLAFKPRKESLTKFSDYFLHALGRKFIFRIEVKEEILGGVIIVYNGTYRDYSLKSQLKKITEEISVQYISKEVV